MNYRRLGKTGFDVSVLGFGCGAVGGLLVKGERPDMVRAVARAIELGVNYFDTAAIYGDGASEANLGSVLAELAADVFVGTKVQLLPDDIGNGIEGAVVKSVEDSLRRLKREHVDLIQLHNFLSLERRADRNWITPDDAERVMVAFEKLHHQGKVGAWGFNGLGETAAVHRAIAGGAQTMQACVNLLNPSAASRIPRGYPFQNFGMSVGAASARQIGVIAIRVLAGGALSGSTAKPPNAAAEVATIATSEEYARDVELARRFDFLVDEGLAGSLAEAAFRFVLGFQEISTVLVGISNITQLEQAARFTEKGPLPEEALRRLTDVWAGFV